MKTETKATHTPTPHEAGQKLIDDIRFTLTTMNEYHKPEDLFAAMRRALSRYDSAIAQAEGRPTDTEIHDYITENPPEVQP